MTISLVALSAVTEPFHNNRATTACHDYIGTQKVHSHLLDNKHFLDNCTTDAPPSNIAALNGSMVNRSSLLANFDRNINNNTHKNTNLAQLNPTNNTQSYKMDNLRTGKKLCSSNNSTGIQHGETDEGDKNVEKIPDSLKYTCLAALMMFVVGYAVGYGPSKLIKLLKFYNNVNIYI